MFNYLLYIAVLVLPFCLHAETAKDSIYKPVDFPDAYTSNLNVAYIHVKEWEGKLDLYLPPLTNKPSGIVINIHGGGWKNGVKESQTGFSSFFKAGFATCISSVFIHIAYSLGNIFPP